MESSTGPPASPQTSNSRKTVPLVIRVAPPSQRPSRPHHPHRNLEVNLPTRLRRPAKSIVLPIRTAPPTTTRKTVVAIRSLRPQSSTPQEEPPQDQTSPAQSPQPQSQPPHPPSKRKIYLPLRTTPSELDPTDPDGYNNTSIWYDTRADDEREIEADAWAEEEYKSLLSNLKRVQANSMSGSSLKPAFNKSRVSKPKSGRMGKEKSVGRAGMAPATRERIKLNETIRKVREGMNKMDIGK
ncbi:hypothetical protein BJ508DRAFT_63230 [Ascobolus immersus RN42]|uniref:Uncharacterized protein n=1 Tax=Ascobolus immersus RN42 TaxID=1160509 RepID=A0A3N4IPK5_ASCIM|nr:hypothetical protein BJ508DRAFT_63230 [Ascobolus immersus RN42]